MQVQILKTIGEWNLVEVNSTTTIFQGPGLPPVVQTTNIGWSVVRNGTRLGSYWKYRRLDQAWNRLHRIVGLI